MPILCLKYYFSIFVFHKPGVNRSDETKIRLQHRNNGARPSVNLTAPTKGPFISIELFQSDCNQCEHVLARLFKLEHSFTGRITIFYVACISYELLTLARRTVSWLLGWLAEWRNWVWRIWWTPCTSKSALITLELFEFAQNFSKILLRGNLRNGWIAKLQSWWSDIHFYFLVLLCCS